MSPPTPPPRPDPEPDNRGISLLAWPVIVLVGLTCAAGLFLILGNVVGGLISFAPVIFLHYLVWGSWLGKRIRRDLDAEDAARIDNRDLEPDTDNAARVVYISLALIAVALALLAIWRAWPKAH